jgi:hypothetical protein
MVRYLCALFLSALCAWATSPYDAKDLLIGTSQQYSRDKSWKPAKGLTLEVSGMALMPNGDPVVCVRKGEIYLVKGAYGNDKPAFHLYARGLHEPLGMIQIEGDLYVTQRAEVTRVRDRNGDGTADSYRSFGSGWDLSGNYHEYAFGPAMDGKGRMWVTLNIGMGKDSSPWADWRGWGGFIEEGKFKPMCAGMRSPAGLATNLDGEVFCVDHQGNWFGMSPLYHLKKGSFFGHRESLAGTGRKLAPKLLFNPEKSKRDGIPYPEAVRKMPGLTPPAVWFPYEKTARGLTGVTLDDTGGKFGPFAGQLFVGEFTQASICRVFLEKVGGEYQGACFRFMESLPSAVLRMVFGKDGSMFVGMSNRGWSSLGTASYGLQRLRWNGKIPFEIQEMRSRPNGFEFVFTKPVARNSAMDENSFSVTSYTHLYQSRYGSKEIDQRHHAVQPLSLSTDGRRLTLKVSDLRELYVFEARANGIRSTNGELLVHPDAYYTLNRIPEK